MDKDVLVLLVMLGLVRALMISRDMLMGCAFHSYNLRSRSFCKAVSPTYSLLVLTLSSQVYDDTTDTAKDSATTPLCAQFLDWLVLGQFIRKGWIGGEEGRLFRRGCRWLCWFTQDWRVC